MEQDYQHDVIILVNSKTKQFFLSTDHCQRVQPGSTLDEDWGPTSFRVPMYVSPRPGFPQGLVASVEDCITIFHHSGTEIENPEPAYRVDKDALNSKIKASLDEFKRRERSCWSDQFLEEEAAK